MIRKTGSISAPLCGGKANCKDRPRSGFLAISLLILAIAPAWAGPIPVMYGTGLSAAGAALAGETPDPHYSLVGPGFPAGPAIVESAGNHWTTWPAGQWDSSADAFLDACCGNFTYTTTLDLIGYSNSFVGTLASFQWAADDCGGLSINGQVQVSACSVGYAALSSYTIDSSNAALTWNSLNTVTFTVDFIDATTNGLTVQMSSAAPSLDSTAPEPAAFFLVIGGLCLIATKRFATP